VGALAAAADVAALASVELRAAVLGAGQRAEEAEDQDEGGGIEAHGCCFGFLILGVLVLKKLVGYGDGLELWQSIAALILALVASLLG
jgi:hypothetical protein